ncbi:MAG: hypothetical protein M1818_003941 [Claussenomyces sp. TS43310]|nr:MAG: hypothetical protein M1818_003941 [Claussenomyces sp. TS43310]
MARFIVDSTILVAVYASVALLFASLVTAQSTSPSNDSLPAVVSQMEVMFDLSDSNSSGTAYLLPLTPQTGLGLNQIALATIRYEGTLKVADPVTLPHFPTGAIAYISCDPNSNISNIDPSTVLTDVATTASPKAIILYSLQTSHCSFNGTFANGYSSLLSMTNAEDARKLLNYIQFSMTPTATATILNEAVATSTSSPTSSPSPLAEESGPTTAVAMSILYSITGIITVLFLIIIATGAIRAHRHPERYGPRRASVAGRPRQSRAKGLARAMLETLPIVKFGDPDPAKPTNREIELESGVEPHMSPENPNAETQHASQHASHDESAPTGTPVSGIGPDNHEASTPPGGEETEREEALGCSICTDDFTKGEDVRVLPCNHKFHPACIDPWLLNVSGTCPLCRVNLNPPAEATNVSGESEGLPPPLGAEEGQATGNIDSAALRTMPASERLAALQDHARARRAQDSGSEGDAEIGGRRASLAVRLRDSLRIHTRSSWAAPESPEAAHGHHPDSGPSPNSAI